MDCPCLDVSHHEMLREDIHMSLCYIDFQVSTMCSSQFKETSMNKSVQFLGYGERGTRMNDAMLADSRVQISCSNQELRTAP